MNFQFFFFQRKFQFSNMILKQFFLLFNCIITTNFSQTIRGYTNNFGDFKLQYCFFIRTTSFNSYGGVIYIYNVECNFSLYDSIFYNCSSSSYWREDGGGAIYFRSELTNSNIYFQNICANRCWTISNSGWNQFCVLFIKNNINNKIQLISCSLTKCSPYIGHGYTTLLTYYGNQTILNFNSSFNYNLAYSGIWNRAPTKLRGLFYTLSNNTVSDFTCLLLSESSNDNIISNSNLINCNSPYSGVVRLWNGGIFQLTNFIFLNNINTLFFVDTGGQLNIDNSFFNNFSSIIFVGSVSTSNFINTITKTFIINHLSTYLCDINSKKTNFFKNILFFKKFFYLNFFILLFNK